MGAGKGASLNYRKAIAMTGNDSERRFLERRLKELASD